MSHSLKRALALMLVFSLLLTALIGCGKKEESSSSSVSSSSSSSSTKASITSASEPEEPEAEPIPEITEEVAEEYASAVEANEDCVGWITIPDSDISFPVMQSDDNSYYWEHDPEGNYLAYGSIYAHYNNDMSSVENLYRNTVLFGHNKYVAAAYPNIQQSDGTPFDEYWNFATLLHFQGENWANSHRYITLTIGEETSYWVIFAALDTETANDQATFYYWNTCFEEDKDDYTGAFTPVWQDTESWTAILDQARNRSYWDYDVEVNPETDKVLTLSTCSYDWGMSSGLTNAKFVVMARQLREDELEQGMDFINGLAPVEENTDRREPDVGRERLFMSVASGQYKAEEYTPDMEGTVPETDADTSADSSAAD